ncbi:MAG TPA: hypothetical protein VGP14_06765 [Casimicrobiaceae bacterium]|nr:hypothetical protein [Casimicrobiaceae bacterium]
MASARELLEQADALMRRNRGRSGVDIPVLTDVVAGIPANDERETDVPVLTDVVEAGAVDGADLQTAVQPSMALEPAEAQHAPPPPQADSVAIMQTADAIPVELPMDGDTSDWLVMDTIDPSTHSITGPGPDTLAVVPPVTLKTEPEPEPESESESESPPAAAPAPVVVVDDSAERAAKAAAEEERWRALAEQVSMQVLQRVDLFTDTGLKTQLAQHLQPIVERASAELIAAITEHVGGVLRTYVAEAIEREIALWRRDH